VSGKNGWHVMPETNVFPHFASTHSHTVVCARRRRLTPSVNVLADFAAELMNRFGGPQLHGIDPVRGRAMDEPYPVAPNRARPRSSDSRIRPDRKSVSLPLSGHHPIRPRHRLDRGCRSLELCNLRVPADVRDSWFVR